MSAVSKEQIERHIGLARDLAHSGCGCDDDATDGCPNWNGERCTFAEYMIAKAIATAEVYAELRGKREGLTEASEIVQDVPLDPQFDLSNGQVTRVCGFAANAIAARLTALSADTPANRGEG